MNRILALPVESVASRYLAEVVLLGDNLIPFLENYLIFREWAVERTGRAHEVAQNRILDVRASDAELASHEGLTVTGALVLGHVLITARGVRELIGNETLRFTII